MMEKVPASNSHLSQRMLALVLLFVVDSSWPKFYRYCLALMLGLLGNDAKIGASQ